MKPTYILRLDDACPYFDRSKWFAIESIIDQLSLVPIIAVVPNNQDPTIRRDEYWPEFWDWIKKKQDINGWIIAVHGYTHKAENNKSGILGINKKSEFSGIPKNIKIKKILHSIKIFEKYGLKTDFFVAPYHSFDFETLKILSKFDFKFVSDGPGSLPFNLLGLKFIPQQLWKYKLHSEGVWTICLHPNTMTNLEINKFQYILRSNARFFLKSKTHLKNFDFETKFSRLLLDFIVMRFKRWLIKFLKPIRDYLKSL